MKRYPKPTAVTTAPVKTTEPASTLGTPADSFDVASELDKLQEVLRREIRNLMSLSSGNKLLPEHSRDLVNYLKLLGELKKEQEEALKNLTDEEIQGLLK